MRKNKLYSASNISVVIILAIHNNYYMHFDGTMLLKIK